MMTFVSLKKISRDKDWGRTDGQDPTNEQLMLGCALRIADATEAMAKYHVDLIKSRDSWEKTARNRSETINRLLKSNAALRGHLKRAKSNSKGSAS